MDRIERIAMKIAGARPLSEAMDAAFDIVDGIDGMMSESGDFPDNFWKKDVLTRYDKLSDSINKMRGKPDEGVYRAFMSEAKDLLADLIDGMEGIESEQGEDTRYWKRGVLNRAKQKMRGLPRAASRTASSFRQGWYWMKGSHRVALWTRYVSQDPVMHINDFNRMIERAEKATKSAASIVNFPIQWQYNEVMSYKGKPAIVSTAQLLAIPEDMDGLDEGKP